MTSTSSSGACLCGAVEFDAAMPSLWVAHCHCTRCRRAHGAAFVTWVGTDAARSTVRDPHSLLRWYAPAGAGERGFCSRCGSMLFFRSERWPGELHIARALFADPVDKAPQAHGYYDTHVDWFEVRDDLPKKADPSAGQEGAE